jgi:hypothetical protein
VVHREAGPTLKFRKAGPTLRSRAEAWMAPGVPTHGLPVSAQRTRGEFTYVHERETGYVSVERAHLPLARRRGEAA